MKHKPDPEQLPDSPIQSELEAKVRELLGPDYTSAPATLDKPAELQAADTTDDAKNIKDTTDAETLSDDDGLDDPVTDRVVDEIEHTESDRLLEADDQELEAAFKPEKTSVWSRWKSFNHDWWHNPIKRNSTVAVIIAGLVALGAVPQTRYAVLNTAGVRASARLTILDAASQQPLKNATVAIGSVQAQSDDEGRVELRKLRLGAAELRISKRAYSDLTKSITVGWGSNPLGDQQLTASGEQFSFVVTDYLSGKPIANAEASIGGSEAQADENGKILLATVAGDEAQEVTVSAQEYRTEKVKLGEDTKSDIAVAMVPSRKNVFISKRSGKYDLYKIDVDGKNEELVLAGSGVERDDMALLKHPLDEAVALVATRENVRNSDGYLLSTLLIVDLSKKEPVKVAQAESITLLGWNGNKLYYVQTVAGTSAGSPNRQKIGMYDTGAAKSTDLFSANYFNDARLVDGSVFFVLSAAYAPNKAGLYKITADGKNQTLVADKELWSLYRTTYGKLVAAGSQDWYEFTPAATTATKIAGPSTNPSHRHYRDSPDGSKSAWVDQRDGKGVLLLYYKAGQEDKTVATVSGLRGPVHWLTDKIMVYRVATGSETADYVVNIEGGEPRKITDVTNTLDSDSGILY